MEPGSERNHPEWNVARARRWQSADGFVVVWLELAAPRPRFAAREGSELADHGDATHPVRVAGVDTQ